MLTIYLPRHLPSTSNLEGMLIGTSEDPIDTRHEPFDNCFRSFGIMMRDLLEAQGLSATVYSSSIKRQLQTCQILFDGVLPIVIDERLRQIEYGPRYTRTVSKETEKVYPEHISHPFPGGESFQDFANRVKSFLDEKKSLGTDQVIITPEWQHSNAIFSRNTASRVCIAKQGTEGSLYLLNWVAWIF